MKYPWNLHLQLIFPWFSHEISIFVTTKLVVWQRCYVSGGGRLESSGGRCLWAAGWRQNGHGDKQVSYNHGSHMCIIYIYIHVHRKYRKDTCNSYYHIYCIYIYTPWIDISICIYVEIAQLCIQTLHYITVLSIYIYIYSYITLHACIHTCMHACMHPYIHTYLHPTYIPTYITYIHTYIHTYLHTYLPTYIHIDIDRFRYRYTYDTYVIGYTYVNFLLGCTSHDSCTALDLTSMVRPSGTWLLDRPRHG